MIIRDNILGLESPEQWRGYVRSYDRPGILVIELLNPQAEDTLGSAISVEFMAIEYFEGPSQWNGANLRIVSQEECLRILHLFPQYKRRKEKMLLWKYRLYDIPIVDADSQSVRVIASHSIRVEQFGSMKLVNTPGIYG